ncbi:MAG: 2-oxoacid:acceptor oxidoreductase family protein [Patescibacteria group bacterium]
MAAEIAVRWHSRAGQGAITASTALAEILGNNGKFVQSFPDFGAEKRGAPVVVFNRISSQKIEDASHPTTVDASVLLDVTLIASCEVSPAELLAGLGKNGLLLVNSPQKKLRMGVGKIRVFAVDASGIAVREIGKDIPNVPILGALVRILGLAKLENFQKDLAKYLGRHLPPEILEGNLRAFKQGFEDVRKIEVNRAAPNRKCAILPSWQKIQPGAAITEPGSSRNYATGNWSRQTCEWNSATCIDCKFCWPVCPHDAVKIRNGKMVGIDETKCTACALCVAACPTKPKSLKIVPKKISEI